MKRREVHRNETHENKIDHTLAFTELVLEPRLICHKKGQAGDYKGIKE